jgi:uncharacterized protein YjdB
MNKTILCIILVLVGIIGIMAYANAATVLKNQPQYLYRWTSSNPSVISVDLNTGYITPIWYGTAEVCAQLRSDMSVKFCNTVTVN